MKPRSGWYASPHLKRIYQDRIKAKGMTQAQFAKQSGIGTQTMISMLLDRDRTLTPQNAVRFCKMLHCTVYDVCPEMADFFSKELLPYLGKALRRAAMLGAMSLGLSLLGGFDKTSFAANADKDLSYKTTEYTMLDRLIAWICSILQPFTKSPASG